MLKDDEIALDEAFDDLFRYTLIMGIKFNWQIIASSLITIGLRLYKTVLDEKDYKEMIEVIRKSFKDVHPFEEIKKPKETTVH
jgi:hypothetical protein|tara:strand:- start:1123 stop:1371 length:249 start_codon:yes stop_codon:yes gene_type:complete